MSKHTKRLRGIECRSSKASSNHVVDLDSLTWGIHLDRDAKVSLTSMNPMNTVLGLRSKAVEAVEVTFGDGK